MKIIEKKSVTDQCSPELPFHPCIHPEAHQKLARIHLPVAEKCNITCRFCARHTSSCRNNLPGTSRGIMLPHEVLKYLHMQRKIWGKNAVVGISGPGEPLANPETFEVLRMIKTNFPSHPMCLCTNGLLLAEKVQELYDLGLRVLSMTINGVDPKVVKRIQPRVQSGKISLRGETAAVDLIKAQMKGLKAAVQKGMFVKVNTVVAEGINDRQVVVLSKKIADSGAGIMNIVPVIPPHEKSTLNPPDNIKIKKLQNECEKYIPQFRLCRQCRSDASGVPGKIADGGCC